MHNVSSSESVCGTSSPPRTLMTRRIRRPEAEVPVDHWAICCRVTWFFRRQNSSACSQWLSSSVDARRRNVSSAARQRTPPTIDVLVGIEVTRRTPGRRADPSRGTTTIGDPGRAPSKSCSAAAASPTTTPSHDNAVARMTSSALGGSGPLPTTPRTITVHRPARRAQRSRLSVIPFDVSWAAVRSSRNRLVVLELASLTS